MLKYLEMSYKHIIFISKLKNKVMSFYCQYCEEELPESQRSEYNDDICQKCEDRYSECPYCGDKMSWCSCCQMWSSICCIEYGTCQCS